MAISALEEHKERYITTIYITRSYIHREFEKYVITILKVIQTDLLVNIYLIVYRLYVVKEKE